MSLQTCPKCHQKSITWYLDEEVTHLTQWWCNQCECKLLEDEDRVQPCTKCQKRSYLVQTNPWDAQSFYRWCMTCNTLNSTPDKFET